jgi:glycosyltransferase involved in cell wall biosynthesis
MRILQVVHGYPPRESAGTEQHTRQLTAALTARGVAVHVVTATRAPGHRQYAVLEEPGITRIVNNIPSRPLSQAEVDPAMSSAVQAAAARFKPDLVHLQHTQFISSNLRFDAPVVATLHDAWAWCAAGGTLLNTRGESCPGPDPARCAPCAAAWRPVPGRGARGLLKLAGALAPLVPPDRLHALYQRTPPRLRARVHRGASPIENEAAAGSRNRALGELFRTAEARISPSQWLARAAEAQGLGPVDVVRHGVPPGRPAPSSPRAGGGPLLFLGTIAHHKGPDLVAAAWRRAFPSGAPRLRIAGPILDTGLVTDHPLEGPLDRGEVRAALARASALVLGSRWPENSPLVVLEARAQGCPVIAPAIGGLPELVQDGVDGRLYPPGDLAALARAMAEVVRGQWPDVRSPPTHAAQVDATMSIYRRAMGRS